jgi:ectoine hydroxylase-related dioxygenase (phytanoyl-CoA dioxygenase family)
MELIPGSHKRGWLGHRRDELYQIEIDDASIPDDERVCVQVSAGDAVLFHPCIIHRSVPNLSDRVKFVILIQIQDSGELLGPKKNLGEPGTSNEPAEL